MDAATSTEYESQKEASSSDASLVRFWLDAIAAASKEEKEWRKEAEELVDIYRGDNKDGQDEFNIVYSNCETLLPAIYNSTPSPDVRRRFGDKDPIAKTIADILERAISYSVDNYDFDAVMHGVLFDGTVPGRGVARVRYMPEFNEETGKTHQAVTCEYVPWQNFRRGAGRTWADVPWVAFEHFLSRDELKKLNPDVAADVQMDCSTVGERDGEAEPDKSDTLKRARVWEIWDKENKEVLFIATGYEKACLKQEDDPLRLTDFWPMPRPVQPIMTPGALVPVTSYRAYKKLAEELNDITRRIKKLIKQMRVRGGYAASNQDLTAITNADDGELVPMQGLEAGIEGGIDKLITWWPLEPAVKALVALREQREAVKQTIYEVTGISDIVRGQSAASETATAQNIKNQWGSLRIQRMQQEVQRFARDLFRLKAEIMATFYEPENLSEITGIKLVPQAMIQQAQQAIQAAKQPPAPQQPGMQPQPPMPVPEGAEEMAKASPLEPVMQIMRSDILRSYRVDVESDSTIRADLTRNQKNMSEFLQGTAGYIQAVGPAVQSGQMPGDVAVEIFTAFARNFKLGKQAEDALDRMGSQAADEAKQPKPQKPDPEMVKAEGQMKIEQAKLQADGQAKMQSAQLDQQKAQADMQMQQTKMQQDFQLAQMKQEGDMRLAEQKLIAEITLLREKAAAEIQIKREQMQAQSQIAHENAENKRGLDMASAEHKASMAEKASEAADAD